MGFISREEFLNRQNKMQERKNSPNEQGNGVGFLKLANDGDEAIVRFCYDNPDEFEIMTVHDCKIPVNGEMKFRRVNCIRESFKDSPETCPFCAAGEKPKNRFYVRLIEYVRDKEDPEKIIAIPKIWDASTTQVSVLNNLCMEYGNISDNVFKIKRNGAKGDQNTQYAIMLANPSVYNANLYPKVEDAFKDYSVLGGMVLDKTFEEMQEILNMYKPTVASTVQENVTKPRTVQYY